ncbi:hypothetical protein BSQ33_02340 [Vibrio gazogenes]|uniref:Uncharacterized protein n=1 Tax=Vibrio gazogenes TaxID=687 RepID=A0A1Z2SBY4_VIBGA|nr:hypothetical protein BSQ33_02340 [Vibrio gazogenes]
MQSSAKMVELFIFTIVDLLYFLFAMMRKEALKYTFEWRMISTMQSSAKIVEIFYFHHCGSVIFSVRNDAKGSIEIYI